MTLQKGGIEAISLDYKEAHHTDAHGNQFRYRAQVVWTDPKENARQHWAYDVTLVASGLQSTLPKGGK
jgi:hypothetical protein